MSFQSSIRPVRIFTCLCLFLLAGQPLIADAPLKGTKPAQWRVIWTSDPSTEAIVSWSTAEPGTMHRLTIWPRGTSDSKRILEAVSGKHTDDEATLYYHHVKLTGLKPSSSYSLQLHSDQDASREFYFVTGPKNDREFSLIHGGDSRSNRNARREVNQMMQKLVAESLSNADPSDDIIAFAHGGDYIATGQKVAQWTQWLSDYELTTAEDGRLLPIIPARGNHDKGKPFNEVFGFPEDDKNYYAINLGPQVRLVTLNTEISTAGNQAKWLDKELKASRPKNRWLVAQYHRPAYPAVKTPGTALQSWVPLFDKHNVDLVCEADGHNIKRTIPIRGNVQDPTGVVYIGEGGLGVAQRAPKTVRWYLQPPGMAGQGNHVFVLNFTKTELKGKCLLVDGTVKDEFTRPIRELAKPE